MPNQSVPIGPISGLYIGTSGQSTPLSELTSTRTAGGVFREAMPSEYVVSVNNMVQVGNHSVALTVSFLGKKDEVIRLMRGLAPGSDINNPMGQTKYALLATGPSPEVGGNYYFPSCYTERVVETQMTKNSTTVSSVTFRCENRDVTVPLHYEGTLVLMASAMGSQYPL